MLAYMAIIVSSMCVEMYNLSSGAEIGLFLRAVFYVNVALIGLVVYYCLPAQNLTDEINRVQHCAYFSKWYNYPREAHSMMLMISAAQRDVNITAGGIININLETSLSTIKTMVSYCMFLQTMGSK
ncbi:unnamed protein product [Acanthoscelides obtectus]|uniref:Uncharacterized protein n=1 Tax=Acanthoscelides obtectus TaxID=200917 RepID=A0A9P0P1Z8_ACAOB|nr:unnamed protein product [Acanthoscelides obtectus]CAK1622734.1 hypothetical protein AOBTE_LOCUS1649 [Acanthoscelides obtectus]